MVEVIHSTHHPGPTGWRRYFSFSTDHKVIGIQYLVTTFGFYLVGGLLAMLIRAELLTPEADFLDRGVYNSVMTLHATVMIFLWIVPSLAGFGNYVVPLMIGARDMAFPRLNAASFWLIPPGGVLLLSSFFLKSGAANAGWWSYPPLSTQNVQVGDELVFHAGQFFWLLSVLILGTSSILAAINFIVTILGMRTHGMELFRMPLFCWATLTTSCIALVGTPVLAAALVLQMFDLVGGTSFFLPAGGGDPVVYQHMFWFYSHPAVYIMILPAMGVVSEILPVFSRKPIFGYKAIAFSSIGIGALGFIVWAHHMFTSATPDWLRMFFMIATMFIAVPTGIKVFSWIATVWGGKIELATPMLFALGFVSMFVIGGLSGIMLASVPFNLHVSNTYFVVAHLHYVLFGGSVFAIYAGLYFWFPKITGRMYNETWGKIHFALTFLGFNLCFLPMHQAGMLGMPRRVAEYALELQSFNVLASVGGFLLGISTLPFLFNAILSWVRGEKAPENPWRALTLEWTTSSPPPVENFEILPIVTEGPYEYGKHSPSGSRPAVVPMPQQQQQS
jgi:cytochrome c oxidase subunit 1